MSSLNVIDVSQYNGTIDWSSVEADGAIIRCGIRGWGSTGTLQQDTKFAANAAGAAAAGVPFGLYFVTQATSTAEAEEEAEYCLQLVSGLDLTFPIYLDVEEAGGANGKGRADSLSKSARTKYAAAFCTAIEAAGYTAGVYANLNWWTSYLVASELAGWSCWCASTGTSTVPDPGITLDAWQHTFTGSDPGVSGNVDKSYFYRDFIAERIESKVAALTQDEFDEFAENWWTRKRQSLQALGGSDWSEEARTWAEKNEIYIGGTSGFMWQDLQTREQTAQVLQRLAAKLGLE